MRQTSAWRPGHHNADREEVRLSCLLGLEAGSGEAPHQPHVDKLTDDDRQWRWGNTRDSALSFCAPVAFM